MWWRSVCLVFAVVMAAACGSGSPDATGLTSVTTESNAGTVSSEATVGGGASTSAPLASFETISDGVLTVGTAGLFPPFKELNDDGEFYGMDIDIVEEVGKRLGFEKFDWVQVEFNTLIAGVGAKRYDIAASALGGWAPEGSPSLDVIKERTEIVSFTRPYHLAYHVLLTNGEENPGIVNPEDLESGMSIGVSTGSTPSFWARDALEPNGVEIVEYSSLTDAYRAVSTGVVDATVTDVVSARRLMSEEPVFQHGDVIPVLTSGYTIAVAPENVELREAMNDALADMLEDGTYEEIFHTYFPDDEVPDLPNESFVSET